MPARAKKTAHLALRVDPALLDQFTQHCDRKGYPSRTWALEHLMRKALEEESKETRT